MVLGTKKRGRGGGGGEGGFVFDPSSSSLSTSNKGHVGDTTSTSTSNSQTQSHSHSVREPLLSLSTRQENRLRIYLDERLVELERDQLTRSFISLDNLINRLTPLIHLILQIPAPPPWGSIRISYLLVLSGHLVDYLTSLPLLSTSHDPELDLDRNDLAEDPSSASASASKSRSSVPLGQKSTSAIPPSAIPSALSHEQPPSSSTNTTTTTTTTATTTTTTTTATTTPITSTSSTQSPSSSSSLLKAKETLENLMDFLNLVERGWCAVLQGKGWIMSDGTPQRQGTGTRNELGTGERGPGTGEKSQGEQGQVGEQGLEGERGQVGQQGQGGKRGRGEQRSRKGISVSVPFGAQVDITERTRLRSIVISSREKLIAWARVYGDFKGSSLPGTSKSGSIIGDADHQEQQQQQDEHEQQQQHEHEQQQQQQDQQETENEIKVDWEDQVLHTWSGILDMLQDGIDNDDTAPERIVID